MEKWGPQAARCHAASKAEISGIAEHHLPQGKVGILEAQIKTSVAHTTPAAPTGRSEEGTIGGTAVLVSKALQSSPIDPCVVRSFFPGKHEVGRRWSACTVRLRDRIVLCISAYFFAGLLLDSPENTQVLKELAALIAFLGLPTIACADWQHTPEQLEQTGWLQKLALEAVRPQAMAYTCKSGARRLIDFFGSAKAS